MSRRRSRLEICLEILSIIHKGTKKTTRIMYAANISWQPLQKYLESLLSQGLIREVDPRKIQVEGKGRARRRRDKKTKIYYEITQRGENVIRYLRGARDLLELEEFNFLKA